MATPRPLKVVACFRDEPTRTRCLQALQQFQAGGRLAAALAGYTVEAVACATPEAGLEALDAHFAASPCNAAVVVSDLLAEVTGTFPKARALPTSWAKELGDHFQDRLFGTVAVLDGTGRVPEIDRVVPAVLDPAALLNALTLCTQRLTYVAPPEKKPELPYPVTVRPIQTQAELQQYFALRHQIYRIMGYLEPAVEAAPTRLEIDWCDTTALHVGAFVEEGRRQHLVGTARVVAIKPLDERFGSWARTLARRDPVLRGKIESGVLPLLLPVFHSMPDANKLVTEVILKDENWGELSRVIVTEDYRGTGLSTVLVRYAVLEAVSKGVDRLLLECLPLHEGLYRKHGFQPLAGQKARVLGVNKTMIAMDLNPDAIEALQQQTAVRRSLEVIADSGHLCLCRQDNCHRGEYHYHGKPECPLVGLS